MTFAIIWRPAPAGCKMGEFGVTAIASDAITMDCYKIASVRHHSHMALTGYSSGIGVPLMRMFETVTSTMLAIAAQALVVGVVVSTL